MERDGTARGANSITAPGGSTSTARAAVGSTGIRMFRKKRGTSDSHTLVFITVMITRSSSGKSASRLRCPNQLYISLKCLKRLFHLKLRTSACPCVQPTSK